MPKTRYLLALGSNQRHVSFGLPREIIDVAIQKLGSKEITVIRRSRTIKTRPLGPSQRRYANAAVVIETSLDPLKLLEKLQSLERGFGTRRGQRWSRRVLDIDIILWDGGTFASDDPELLIPHSEMRGRGFVLQPAVTIAANWRDPLSGLTLTQLWWRLKRRENSDRLSSKPA